MLNLSIFNEPEILNNLSIRFHSHIYYTYIGNTLLTINPYSIPVTGDIILHKYI